MRIVLAFSLALAAGCGGAIEGAGAGLDTATLTAAWSIEGRTDDQVCHEYGDPRMQVVVVDTDGNVRASIDAPCEDFEATVLLRVGLYDASATFVAPDGRRSTTLHVPRFALNEDTQTISIEFSRAAMGPLAPPPLT